LEVEIIDFIFSSLNKVVLRIATLIYFSHFYFHACDVNGDGALLLVNFLAFFVTFAILLF
jgi:hypothetical protein